MLIFPAIDLRGGHVVRLRQGNPKAQTIWSDDPERVAQRWVEQGATWLHVVNLDGALARAEDVQSAGADNLAALRRILDVVAVPVQFGGGLRDLAGSGRVLQMGVARVVLGTLALERPQMVGEALERFGAERVVVGLDARAGLVASHGWQTQTPHTAAEVARVMRTLGVQRVVFTDIARDGMLEGVDVGATRELARASGLKVIASGGVATLDDIRRLKAAEVDGVEGAIVGQALYTGAIGLKDALEIAEATGNLKLEN